MFKFIPIEISSDSAGKVRVLIVLMVECFCENRVVGINQINKVFGRQLAATAHSNVRAEFQLSPNNLVADAGPDHRLFEHLHQALGPINSEA